MMAPIKVRPAAGVGRQPGAARSARSERRKDIPCAHRVTRQTIFLILLQQLPTTTTTTTTTTMATMTTMTTMTTSAEKQKRLEQDRQTRNERRIDSAKRLQTCKKDAAVKLVKAFQRVLLVDLEW